MMERKKQELPKWQRIRYMPATPLYKGQERVTESAAHIALSRRAAADGMVLLKNEGGLLPFAEGAKIAVFGKAQIDYVKGGGGSGDVTVSYVRNIVDGFCEKEAEGRILCFQPLTAYYHADVARQRAEGKEPGRTVEPELPDDLLRDARAYTDTAVITICRFSGEGWDRTGEAYDGDFFLSREEEAMAQKVLSAFPRVAVVLNAGGMMDTRWIHDDPRVTAALLAGQGGMEGGSAVADILCGDVCPSGHLTDTYAVDFASYPSSAGFAESDSYVAYEDDIFVGYRYFETIPGAAEKVLYPFGFGLSYTRFERLPGKLAVTEEGFELPVLVTNVGEAAGREVAQLYASLPQGKLGQPARVLVAFAKTGLLQPGTSEQLLLKVPYRTLASYDDVGKVRRSAWLLEKGTYRFYLGGDVRAARELADTWELAEDRVLEQVEERCAPHDLARRLCPDGTYEAMPERAPFVPYQDKDYPWEGQRPTEWCEEDPTCCWFPSDKMQLDDVFRGELSLDDFMKGLTTEQLVHLLGGRPDRGAANTFGMGDLPVYGVPNAMTADGPAGLRIKPECGVETTAFPTASLIASTWDEALAEEIGHAGAEEVLENGIGIWLTPAINIHRSPLCGRNFEYYSEDPLLAGKLAAGMIRGIQSMKVACSLKHFCCNNKETERKESDSRVSERALRQIYLKAFEICVKEADPWTIMSSYNRVNGVRSSQNRELLTDILRGEWGYRGMVTTDWCTHGEHWLETAAGNDVKMPRGDDAGLLAKLRSGELDPECVRTSARRVLEMLLKLA